MLASAERKSQHFKTVTFAIRLFSMLIVAATTSIGSDLKPVSIFVEGDSAAIPKFINVCRHLGPDRGLDIRFVDRQSDKYDYRVVITTEGASAWDFAHG